MATAAGDNGLAGELNPRTRTRILEGALQAIGRHGLAKLGMSDVSEHAGVSRGTLYRYFPSREELLQSLAVAEGERFQRRVSEALRGQVGEEYTFRQFGLKEPRRMGNGKVYLGVTPEGWAKYEVGEQTMLFLHKAASMTGLRTTAGLGQGKVVFKSGNAVSQAGNEGLFERVEVNANLLNDRDKRLLATKKGAVNAEGFKSFVERAVKENWIEGGKMRHVKK